MEVAVARRLTGLKSVDGRRCLTPVSEGGRFDLVWFGLVWFGLVVALIMGGQGPWVGFVLRLVVRLVFGLVF